MDGYLDPVVVHKHSTYLLMVLYQPEDHPQNIFDTKLIAIGIPIEASVPKNPPSTCFLVGFMTNLPPVLLTLLIWSICDFVNSFTIHGNIGKYFFGILIPLPKILSIPTLPRAETAPVANAGTAFKIPFTAKGNNFCSKRCK